jgi:hypothetical protein
MDEQDCALLMRYLRARMHDVEMGEIADAVVEQLGPEGEPPSRQLMRMLDALGAELRLQDADTASRVVSRLGEVAQTSEGYPPEGLWLDLSAAHRDLFGVDGVDMRDGPFLRDVIEDLEALQTQIRDELGGSQWR